MGLSADLASERVLSEGDEWQSWRALRLAGDDPGDLPPLPGQDPTGGFVGPSGRLSAGATAASLCHLVVLSLGKTPFAVVAADWIDDARTPAGAWLDAPDDVPGLLDDPAGARVWATAASAAALLSVGRDPGRRAIDLLRGEADVNGRFTGGAYPTFAAAAAYWLVEGPKTEMAEWALRWAREFNDEWEPAERVTALTFWAAARVPAEHHSVEMFLDALTGEAPPEGWESNLELTLRALELMRRFGA
ncbi:MAG: hypothetical protein ACRDJJ_10445 [Actinomycetota bacterium]